MILFFSGNRSIKHLSDTVCELVDSTMKAFPTYDESSLKIITGDASGVDSFIQAACANVTVYHSGDRPRNLHDHINSTFKVEAHGTGRAWHTYKDKAMSDDCTHHIGFVDTSQYGWETSGTVANHKRVLAMGKPSTLICINTEKEIDL